jgi:tRNA modification GTPase
MNPLFSDDSPIIALASAKGINSAIGLIRLSGFDTLDIFENCLSLPIKHIKPRYSHYTKVMDGALLLDEVVINFFPAPHSFNGENILEISAHGNQINLDKIIDFFISKKKFRNALGGEFTYRGLKNKKLSLSQVEGLDLLLNAQTPFILNQGLQCLSGNLFRSYRDLQNLFINLKSSLELLIDFSEDVGEAEGKANFHTCFNNFHQKISTLNKRCQINSTSLSNPTIVLTGQTNAGKSSLFNYLLQDNRAIVSSKHGTTRDYLTESINISGSQFRLCDTAGLREGEDPIEIEGIERSLSLVENAFYKILVINPFSVDINEIKVLGLKLYDLIVVTHCDVAGFKEYLDVIKPLLNSHKTLYFSLLSTGSIGPDSESGSIEPLVNEVKGGSIGAICEENSDNLFSFILSKYLKLIENDPILVERQKIEIHKIYSLSANLQSVILLESDLGIIDAELHKLQLHLFTLIGITHADDVLDSIFQNFCIGK